MQNLKEFFNSTRRRLYHYTSYENGLNIIKTGCLRFGKLKKMNDINELYRPLFYTIDCEYDEEKAQSVIDHLQQISLTKDTKSRMGFDIPSMWGHYADKGNGVCLVFDKQKLLKNLPKEVLLHHAIKYSNSFHPSIIFHHSNIKIGKLNGFTIDELKQEFFTKTKDWEHEQEYRILAENEIDKKRILLPLNDSLIAVIMHNAPDISKSESIFDSQQFQELSELISKNRIGDYGYFYDKRIIRVWTGDQIWSSVNEDSIKLDV